MSLRKYQAAVLIVAINISTLFPSVLFAEKTNNIPVSTSQSSFLSKEVHQKFLKEKQYLKSLGNPSEYKSVEVQWDNESGKPEEIRKLHKKASKDIADDTKKVLGDFASLYNNLTPSQVPNLRLEKDTTSKLTKERHARIQQFYGNLEIV